MADTDKAFVGSIPEIYDTYLVPLIFEAYAADLARRVAAESPARVLETAAGTGVVTRELVKLLRPDARYVVSDLNQPMLDRAASRQGDDARIVWRQADALYLPCKDAEFDALVCQFGVMFFPDRVAAYREALRVLKPDGRFLFNVWNAIEHNDLARVVTEAAADVFPHDPPRFLARLPHGYSDVRQIEVDLKTAGFSSVEIITMSETSRAHTARDPAVAYCQGTPLRSEIEARDPEALATVTRRAAEAIAKSHGAGPLSAKIQAHIITARP